MMNTIRNIRWSTLLTLALAAVLLLLALRGTNWSEMLSTVKSAQPVYLGVACLLGSAAYFVRGLRWRILLSAERATDPVTVFWATMAGYLGNGFLPARAGELIRAKGIGRRYGIGASFVLATAITERMLDAAALVAIGGLAATAIGGLPEWLISSFQVLGLVGALGFLALFQAARLEAPFRSLMMRLPITDTLRSRALRYVQEFLLGTRTFQHRGRAVRFAGLTIVIWLMEAVGAILAAWTLQLALTLPQALLLLALLGLSSALPSTPGAVGIYQFVGVSLLPSFGISQSQALTYMIVTQGANYLIVTVWGLPGLWHLMRPLPQGPAE
jgi:uncharacterized protein (TIRG00374 family)